MATYLNEVDTCSCSCGSEYEMEILSPSVPADSCVSNDGGSLPLMSPGFLPDVVRSSRRSSASQGSSAPSEKDSITARIAIEDQEFLDHQAKSYISVDILSLSTSYDADVETLADEGTSSKIQPNMSSGMDKEESGLYREVVRGVVGTLVTSLLALGLMAITKAIDPQLSTVFALLTYKMSYYIAMAVIVLFIIITCANTVRALIKIPSKCSRLAFLVLSITFIALALYAIDVLVQYTRSS